MKIPISVSKVKARGGRTYKGKKYRYSGPKRIWRAYFIDDETGKLVTRYIKGLDVFVLKAQIKKRKTVHCPGCGTKYITVESVAICPKCGGSNNA